MPSFFPTPYPDELLYSVIGRYHLRSGNSSPKWTYKELFGTEALVINWGLPSHIEAFAQRTYNSAQFDADYWIDHHTLFPLFAPFLPKERSAIIRKMMKGTNGSGIYTLIGLAAGSIAVKKALCFCLCCYEEDIRQYGEPYWHRSHQAFGVFVCPIHKVSLHEITSPVEDRQGITVLPISSSLFQSQLCLPVQFSEKNMMKLSNFAIDAAGILKADVGSFFSSKGYLLPRLADKGLVTAANRIRQIELQEQFIAFYGNELLEFMESDVLNDSSWLKFVTRKERRTINPVRFLLLIRFLYGSWSEFVNVIGAKYQPFGDGPWPCLNGAADHYKQNVIRTLEVARCSDTGKPIGIFTCNCGFIFSRRGPDLSSDDKERIGKVRQYGPTWRKKVMDYLNKGLSYRKTATLLGVDVGTVIKHSRVDGIDSDQIQKQLKISVSLKRLKTQTRSSNKPNNRIDWIRRDVELSKLVEQTCREMLLSEDCKPIRIRFTTVAKKVGKLRLLGNNKEKLPKTVAVMNQYIESTEQFQIRRIKWAACKHQGRQPLKKWQLIKAVGLRPGYSKKVGIEIEKYVS